MDARARTLVAVDVAAESARKLLSLDERYNTRELVAGGARAFDAELSHAYESLVDDAKALQRASHSLEARDRLEVFRLRYGALRALERALAMRPSDLPRLARNGGMSNDRRRRLRSLYDTVLTNTLRFADTMRDLNTSVTSGFNDLCKGITTFRGDALPARGPIYHRAHSCHMNCVVSPPDDVARRAENARSCYVERLLYDRVYEAVLGRDQDMPHRYELRTVERMFQECFPGKAVDVSLAFAGDVATVRVTTIAGGAAESVEVYNKIGDRVACDLVEYDGSGGRPGRVATKVQSYDSGPARWAAAGRGTAATS